MHFMYNACMEESVLLIDIYFSNEFGEIWFNNLLAHEMHYYLKTCAILTALIKFMNNIEYIYSAKVQ